MKSEAGGSDADAWRALWAKAPAVEKGEARLWSPLHTHLTDTGAVMGLIWKHWAGHNVQQVVAQDCGGDVVMAGKIAALVACLHDIGKATCAFAGQVPEMRNEIENRTPLRWAAAAVPADSKRLPHATAGHVLVKEFLESRNVPSRNADAFAVIIGGHHGVPPTNGELVDAMGERWLFGSGPWNQARDGLLHYLTSTLELDEAIEALQTVKLSDASQVLLTGLVIMADWIASNPDYFGLVRAWQDNTEDPVVRAARGWRALSLPRQWKPTSESLDQDVTALLQSRFDVKFEANDVQRATVQAARTMPEPGLIVVEAVMGVGKTEASLLAAEVLASRFGFTGVFYGLPTRATADGIFPRLLPWWEGVPGEDDGDRGVALRHGAAALNETYRGLPKRGGSREQEEAPLAGELADVGRDVPHASGWGSHGALTGQAIAHFWTSGRKQASFADTVVATIDHELLAALSARHVVLRHLGLARQVVVLDEVHAADTWMFAYLARALQWLGRYGVPVIAMSATLAPPQRQLLVNAYEKGRRARIKPRTESTTFDPLRPRAREASPPTPSVPTTSAYPLITVLSNGQVVQYTPAPGPERTVTVEWMSEGDDELISAIQPVTEAGGCVLIVCNTVSRAIATYRMLRTSFGERVSLAHSRFVGHDRVRNDDRLRNTFGPEPGDRAGRVVVATQVAEQSLDVDFDLLISDIAPIDLILQRLGRLHRHLWRHRLSAFGQPRILIRGLTELPTEAASPVVERGAVAVYGEYLLIRSAALLHEYAAQGKPLRLPTDVPMLVQRCYDESTLGPKQWQTEMDRAQAEFHDQLAADRNNAAAYLLREPGCNATLVDLLARDIGEAETSGGATKGVRKDDGGFEVILLQRIDDGYRLLPHVGDDRFIPVDTAPDAETTRLLARSTVRIPGWVTANPVQTEAVLTNLCENYFKGWQRKSILAGHLVLLLDRDLKGKMGPFPVRYDEEVGMEVERG